MIPAGSRQQNLWHQFLQLEDNNVGRSHNVTSLVEEKHWQDFSVPKICINKGNKLEKHIYNYFGYFSCIYNSFSRAFDTISSRDTDTIKSKCQGVQTFTLYY